MTIIFDSGIQISDREKQILENDLLDIEQWVQSAIIGKINNCKKRMIREWHPKLMADPAITMLPATEDGLVDVIIAHSDYKNRAQREIKMIP